MKRKIEPIWYALALYLLAVAAMVFAGCNPVKRVLHDKAKLDKVAEVVVRSGYCANDTTIITKSDTLVHSDTITNIEREFWVKKDTVYQTMKEVKYVRTNTTIRDTIKVVIESTKHIDLLKSDIQKLEIRLDDAKSLAHERLKIIIFLGLLIAAAVAFKLFIKR